MSHQQLFRKSYLRFLGIFFTILTFVLSPIFLFLVLELNLRRFLTQKCSRIFRHDLGKMLSHLANIWACSYPEMFESQALATLYVSVVINNDKLNGTKLDLKNIRELMLEKVVDKKVGGKLVNPELQQTITKWMGFLFWKWDKEFRIENHVNYLDGNLNDPIYEDEVPMIMKELAVRPFVAGRSPWEMLIIPNGRLRRDEEGREKLIFIFRIHHSVADGYSLLKLLKEDLSGNAEAAIYGDVWKTNGYANHKVCETAQLPQEGVSEIIVKFIRKCAMGIYFAVRIPYELSWMVFECQDKNEWHLSEEKLAKKFNSALSPVIPIERVKQIKQTHQCSFYAVVAAAITGGIRNFMLEEGIEIPQSMHVVLPLPVKRPNNRLRNYWSCVMTPLPVHLDSKRIAAIKQNFETLQTSTTPFSMFQICNFFGMFPPFWTKIFSKWRLVTGLCSEFPGAESTVQVMGHQLEDVVFSTAPLAGNIGFHVNSLSYDGRLRILVSVDSNIIPDPQKVHILAGHIVAQFSAMAKGESYQSG